MKLQLKDCAITAIDGGSEDISPACPTCWGGEEWEDYVYVDYKNNEKEWSQTYYDTPIMEFLDMIFDLIDSKEIQSLTHEEFESKIHNLKEL